MATQDEYRDKEALVCIEDPVLLKRVVTALEGLQFSSPFSAEDAVERVRSHMYEVIVLSETFRCEGRHDNMVLAQLAAIQIDHRRQEFVVLMGKNLVTGDGLTAFASGVDAVLNSSEIENVTRLVWHGIALKKVFYRRFMDSLESTSPE